MSEYSKMLICFLIPRKMETTKITFRPGAGDPKWFTAIDPPHPPWWVAVCFMWEPGDLSRIVLDQWPILSASVYLKMACRNNWRWLLVKWRWLSKTGSHFRMLMQANSEAHEGQQSELPTWHDLGKICKNYQFFWQRWMGRPRLWPDWLGLTPSGGSWLTL